MSFRPSFELLIFLLLLAFLGAGFRLLTEPGKYLPQAAPHAGQAFTDLVLVAGPTGVRGLKDAKGEDAQFYAPRAIALDKAGNLYVLDTGNHALRKVAADGTVSTLADLSGEVGEQAGDYPDGMAVDAAGNIYISEVENHVILRVSPKGDKSVFAGLHGVAGHQDGSGLGASFKGPSGLAFDAEGNLLVADTGNNAIRRITPAGEVSTLAGGSAGMVDGPLAKAKFNGPWGLAVENDGSIYVAEMNVVQKDGKPQAATALRRIGKDGMVKTLAVNARRTVPAGAAKTPLLLDGARAIALDHKGNLYYLRQTDIQRVSLKDMGDAVVLPTRTTLHPVPQALAGLAFDNQGNLFAADAQNDYLFKITPDLHFDIFAGAASFNGKPGQQGPIAGLDLPLQLRGDGKGNIFVLFDGLTKHIRKLTPDNQISDTLNRLVDTGKVKVKTPDHIGPNPVTSGAARIYRGQALENVFGFHFFSLEMPGDNSFPINLVANTFAVDEQQNLFIPSQCGNHNDSCVLRITPEGGAKIFASGFTQVQDIQTDRNGNVFVYDAVSSKHRLKKQWVDHLVVLTPKGQFDRAFDIPIPPLGGNEKAGPDPAHQETALVVGDFGDMYIGRPSSVIHLNPQGQFNAVAGSASESGYLDARGEAARFKGINDLALGKDGIIYVSEGGNNALRQIASDGTVSTVANSRGEGNIHLDEKTTGKLDGVRGIAALPEGRLAVLNRYAVLKTQ